MRKITGLVCQSCKRQACIKLTLKEIELMLCEDCMSEVLEKAFDESESENEKGTPAA